MGHKKEMKKIRIRYIDKYSFICLWSPTLLNKTYPIGHDDDDDDDDDDDPLFEIVKGSIPCRKKVNELLRIYPSDTFNFEYLKHYWAHNKQ